MDIATIIGLVAGMGLIIGSIMIGGGGLGPFVDVPSVMITIGGSVSALFINFSLGQVLSMFGVVKCCFMTRLPTPMAIIDKFKELSAMARKDGLLALEEKVAEVKDDFMRRGLEMVVSGTPREELLAIMETEVAYIDERHKNGKKILDSFGSAAPAFGMIGTLIGLVQMLRTLDDPSKIGGGMAVALLTTLYGAVVANVFCIPLAGKLESRNKDEIMVRELMLSGLLALVEGQTPRAIQGRLAAYLSPKARPSEETTAA
jgi:chemotaxis protein MotA